MKKPRRSGAKVALSHPKPRRKSTGLGQLSLTRFPANCELIIAPNEEKARPAAAGPGRSQCLSRSGGVDQNTERKLGCLGGWQRDRYKPRVGAGDRRFLCRPRRRFQPQEEDFR